MKRTNTSNIVCLEFPPSDLNITLSIKACAQPLILKTLNQDDREEDHLCYALIRTGVYQRTCVYYFWESTKSLHDTLILSNRFMSDTWTLAFICFEAHVTSDDEISNEYLYIPPKRLRILNSTGPSHNIMMLHGSAHHGILLRYARTHLHPFLECHVISWNITAGRFGYLVQLREEWWEKPELDNSPCYESKLLEPHGKARGIRR